MKPWSILQQKFIDMESTHICIYGIVKCHFGCFKIKGSGVESHITALNSIPKQNKWKSNIFSIILNGMAELSLPCHKLPEPILRIRGSLLLDMSFTGVMLLYAKINSKWQLKLRHWCRGILVLYDPVVHSANKYKSWKTKIMCMACTTWQQSTQS